MDVDAMEESIMKPLVWPLLAALMWLATGCTDDYALYRSPKYVPGYKPVGDTSTALVHTPPRDTNLRER
jgi:hypothetical protein